MIATPPPGATLVSPPFAGWFDVRRPTLNGRADAWRAEMFSAAKKFSAPLGVASPAGRGPLIMAGHQPYFYHPGVMFKYRLLRRASADGALCVNLSVDTDPSDGIYAKLPHYDGGWRKGARHLAPEAMGAFFADVRTDGRKVKEFTRSALADLASLPERELFAGGARFLEGMSSTDGEGAVAALVRWRLIYSARWEGAVLELPLSALCETGGFFDFAFDMTSRADDVARVFNGALAAYRAEHKLRSRANPFPDLAMGEGGTETLFWLVRGAKRETLSVRAEGGKVAFGGASFVDGAALRDHCAAEGLRLWPKAVALSCMARLYLSDLFVHGVGGAKYDRITDALIRGVYGMEPPVFATASATPAEVAENPSARLMELKQTLRETGFHPEDYLETPPPALIEEKRSLLATIHLAGADKKAIGQRLSAINGELAALLGPFKKGLEERITEAERLAARHESLCDRELAYFLFPPESLLPGDI